MNNVKQRFESKYDVIPFHDCYEWNAAKCSKGYGWIFNNGPKRAHRVSYELYKGKIPKQLQVLHTCDNPGCVRPEHLFLGTNKNNIEDKVNKNRQSKGSQRYSAKLNEKDIPIIKSDYETGKYTHRSLAIKYNVTCGTISQILNNKAWKHVK